MHEYAFGKSSARVCICFLGLVFVSLPLLALPKNRQPVPELSQEAAIDLLYQLRSLRLDRDVFVEFELESLPRNAATSRTRGRLAWSWDEAGLLQRLTLLPVSEAASNGSTREWILHSGPQSRAWMRTGSQPFEPVNGVDLLQPLIPAGLFSAFDFLMPFVHWQTFRYEEAGRLKSREVHYISLLAPKSDPIGAVVSRVRLALDARYAVPLSIKRYDQQGRLEWEQKIESIQKIEGQYMPKQYVIKSSLTGDRERFVMRSVKLQGPVNSQLFDPAVAVSVPH
jgi:hypothetical protein